MATPSECSSVSGDEPVVFFSDEWEDSVHDPDSGSSHLSPIRPLPVPQSHADDGPSTPLLAAADDEDEASAAAACAASNESVLQNIFTSLSCRNEDTSTNDDGGGQKSTGVKHVRLRDRMEPVQREYDYS